MGQLWLCTQVRIQGAMYWIVALGLLLGVAGRRYLDSWGCNPWLFGWGALRFDHWLNRGGCNPLGLAVVTLLTV